jgi:hypothetical protein
VKRLRALLLALGVPVLALGCSSLQEAKSAIKTTLTVVEEAAKLLCIGAHAESLGVSAEAVRETVCKAESEWRPFVDEALAAQRVGAIKVGLGKP